VLADDHALDVGENSIPGLLDQGHVGGAPPTARCSRETEPALCGDTGWYAGVAR
jgi:hypothetical protein